MKRIFIILGMLTVLAAPALAQRSGSGDSDSDRDRPADSALRDEPGYVDFGDLMDLSDGDEIVDVHLTQPLLSITKYLVIEEDPELAEMMGELKLIKAQVFSFEADQQEELEDRLADLGRSLGRDRWQRIIKVSGEDEWLAVHILLDETGGTDDAPMINGLVITALNQDWDDDYRRRGDDNQAVLVNIVGRIDFGKLHRLGRHLDIPQLEDLDDDYDKYRRSDRDRDDDRSGGGDDGWR